ncbi:MAG TPA: Hsp20/alpha crystallin family protein [Terriglobales bacterium]|nr:Hsp20/alpha crystallin family protein [Terriglobales bacterium]
MSSMITRWDPFRELAQLQDRVNRLFQETGVGGREEGISTASFVPPVDIYETEQNIVLKMEVPGVEQKDLDIRIENNTITVRGERKFEKEVKEENFHRVERRYGSFQRSFSLPNTVNTEQVSADYDNGVLKITLAKRAEAKPKQIKVNVGGGQKTIESKGQAA